MFISEGNRSANVTFSPQEQQKYDDTGRINSKLRSFAEDTLLPQIQQRPSFGGGKTGDKQYHRDSSHPNYNYKGDYDSLPGFERPDYSKLADFEQPNYGGLPGLPGNEDLGGWAQELEDATYQRGINQLQPGFDQRQKRIIK